MSLLSLLPSVLRQNTGLLFSAILLEICSAWYFRYLYAVCTVGIGLETSVHTAVQPHQLSISKIINLKSCFTAIFLQECFTKYLQQYQDHNDKEMQSYARRSKVNKSMYDEG